MTLDLFKKGKKGIGFPKLKETAGNTMSKLKDMADAASTKANNLSASLSNISNSNSIIDFKSKGKDIANMAENLGFSKSLEKLTANPVFKRVDNVVEASGTVTMSLNWAYDMTMSDSLPMGLANSMTLAREYKEKAETLTQACNSLIKMEMAKTCCGGFLTSLYGVSSIPVNMSLVFFLQLRMVNAIASLGGCDLEAENVKKIAFMTLTGASMSKDMIKNSLPTIMKNVATKLAPKMLGTGALMKSIPLVSGVVGTSIDAVTTYGIAKLAQSQFLGDTIERETYWYMQEQRIGLLINMAHADNRLADEEKQMLLTIINETDIPESQKEKLIGHIDDTTPIKIDFNPLKKDKSFSNNVMTGLVEMMKADGEISPKEKAFLQETAKSLGLPKAGTDLLS